MDLRSIITSADRSRLRAALCGVAAGHIGAAVAIAQGSALLGAMIWCAGLAPALLLGLARRDDRKNSAFEIIRNLRALSGFERAVASTFLVLAAIFFHPPTELTDLCGECVILLVPVGMAALVFGVGYGLYAAFLVSLVEWFAAVPPRFTFGFDNWSDVPAIAAFFGLAICAALIFQSVYRVLATRRV